MFACCGGTSITTTVPKQDNEEYKNRMSCEENENVKYLIQQLFGGNDNSVHDRRTSAMNNTEILNCRNIKDIFTWSFHPCDIDGIDATTFARIVMCIFEESNILKYLKVDPLKMHELCVKIGQLYYDALNPYHNIWHALHVFHSMHMILKSSGEDYKEHPVEIFSAYIAALCHDIDHCGCTNKYLIDTKHAKAIEYNFISPQEMHHASVTLRLISKFDVLSGSSVEKRSDLINELVMRFILATNIAFHDTFLSSYNPERITQRIKLYLKCADLSHTFSELHNHISWINMLQDEFFIQGDKERFHRLDITPMFDRKKRGILESTQASFFEMVVNPMFRLLYKTCPGMDGSIREAIKNNFEHWKSID